MAQVFIYLFYVAFKKKHSRSTIWASLLYRVLSSGQTKMVNVLNVIVNPGYSQNGSHVRRECNMKLIATKAVNLIIWTSFENTRKMQNIRVNTRNQSIN